MKKQQVAGTEVRMGSRALFPEIVIEATIRCLAIVLKARGLHGEEIKKENIMILLRL